MKKLLFLFVLIPSLNASDNIPHSYSTDSIPDSKVSIVHSFSSDAINYFKDYDSLDPIKQHHAITDSDLKYQFYKKFIAECLNISHYMQDMFNNVSIEEDLDFSEHSTEFETYANRISTLYNYAQKDKKLKDSYHEFKKQENLQKFKKLYKGKIDIEKYLS